MIKHEVPHLPERMPDSPSIDGFPFLRSGCAFALLSSFLLAGSLICAQAPPSAEPSEQDVRAGDLLNFGRFLRHADSPQPGSSFDICTLGEDPVGHSIDEVAARETINNLPVRVRHLPDVTDAKGCAILYISRSEGDHLREDLAILGNAEILTVSDASDFQELGGMIQFLLVENHVRFAVNLNAVTRARLVLSSDLLRVAYSVNGKPPAEDQP